MILEDNKVSDIKSNSSLELFLRYFTFWPYFLLTVILFLSATYIYLKYSPSYFVSSAKIEILDDAMDSDMALPTAMTIFNRSTINLDNEIEVLKSYKLLESVVNDLQFNIEFYSDGIIKSDQEYRDDWFEGMDYNFSLNNELISQFIIHEYEIIFNENEMIINDLTYEKSYSFKNFDTDLEKNDLNFNLSFEKSFVKNLKNKRFSLKIKPVSYVVSELINEIEVFPVGQKSDIISISYYHTNPKLSNMLIDKLIDNFDSDGIYDRRLVFKRTIDFVDERFDILKNELESIEIEKQKFKQDNGLSFIESDAEITSSQFQNYNAELFKTETQLEISTILLDLVTENKEDLIPIDLGLDNISINSLISEYNENIIQTSKILLSVGKGNPSYIELISSKDVIKKNIVRSLNYHKESLNNTIKNLKDKEANYNSQFLKLPLKERLLREINREQEIKEALFLLLLQKREEASINFAVTKPSIKIIDFSRSSLRPVKPNKLLFYFSSILLGVFIPLAIIYFIFLFDDRIHTRKTLEEYFKSSFVLAEIPLFDVNKISQNRSIISEAFRMLSANTNYILNLDKKKNNTILVTSTIKGEGKTFISVNLAKTIANTDLNKKVLLLGCDLRNPQIHKEFNISKDEIGITDYLMDQSLSIEKLLRKEDNLFYITSGKIPPNPNQLINSNQFSEFLNKLKSQFDTIIIDTTPSILVSDALLLTKYVDNTIYCVRSNYTRNSVLPYIKDLITQEKFPKISFILNGVGASQAYGYKYGYQYGYKYNYKYSYNYGYTYGYGDEDKS